MESLKFATDTHIRGNHSDRLARWVPSAGYENTSVWCRNGTELVNAITHGEQIPVMQQENMILKDAISLQDALDIVGRLIKLGRAEIVPMQDGSVTWNIHHRGKDNPLNNATIAS